MGSTESSADELISDTLAKEFPTKKKRRGNLPKAATNLLKKWVFENLVRDSSLPSFIVLFLFQ
jgi:hypothetical protein